MTTPDHYAVFGHPIAHSKSPRIHQMFARQLGDEIIYTAQDVPPDCFVVAVRSFQAGGGKGLNCTVPLKELAFRLADQLSSRAELSGAVNTLMWRETQLFGDNTDGVGLLRDLTTNLGLTLKQRRILILGAGGAVRGILGPILMQQPSQIVIANRTLSRAEELAQRFGHLGRLSTTNFINLAGSQFDLIINATAAGLKGETPPLPEGLVAAGGCCYDLMYGDQPTPFVRWGEAQGAKLSTDGLGMLVEQAAEAYLLWRGTRPETKEIITQLRHSK